MSTIRKDTLLPVVGPGGGDTVEAAIRKGLPGFVNSCSENSTVPILYGTMRIYPNIVLSIDTKDYGKNVNKNIDGGAASPIGIESHIELVFCAGHSIIKNIYRGASSVRSWINEVVGLNGQSAVVNLGGNPNTNAMYEDLSIPGIVRMQLVGTPTSQSPSEWAVSSWFHIYYFGRRSMEYIEKSQALPDVSVSFFRRLIESPISNTIIGTSVNPASVIYDLLTNVQYGLKIAVTNIDVASFNTIADILFASSTGISLLVNYSEARRTIDKICSTVGISLIVNIDHKFELRKCQPIDGSSFVTTLLDAHFKTFTITMQTFEDTFNIVIATYTDHDQAKTKSISLSNEGNIALTGSRRKQTFDLSFFTDKDIATKRLFDILNTVSYPVSTIDCTVSEEFYWLEPGDVVRVKHTESNIDQPYRVITIYEPTYETNDLRLFLEEVPYYASGSEIYSAGTSEGTVIDTGTGESSENLTFPAFTDTATAFSAPFVDPTKVHVRWGSGQEATGELVYLTDFTISTDKIVLDATIFANTIQANALGLLNVDVWETA